jgi:ABC-type transporter Mla subunit MlaD
MRTFVQAIGLIILLAAVIAGTYWYAQHRQVLQYSILFDESRGILPGDPVRIEKVDIGSVEEVEVVEDRQTRVTVRIESRYRSLVRSESTATIEKGDREVAGRYVRIHNLDSESPPINPGAEIQGSDSWAELQAREAGRSTREWLDSLTSKLDDIEARLDELAESEEAKKVRAELDELSDSMARWAAGKYEEFQEDWPEIRERLREHYEKARAAGNESLSKAIEDMMNMFGVPAPTPEP